jgi:hypothetical protein
MGQSRDRLRKVTIEAATVYSICTVFCELAAATHWLDYVRYGGQGWGAVQPLACSGWAWTSSLIYETHKARDRMSHLHV